MFIVAGSVISARVPTSLPVPAVVGIWASATRRAGARFGPEMSAQALVAGDEDGDELGEVHGAAAAEADDRVGVGRLGRGDGGLEVRQVGLGLDVAEERGVARPRMSRRAALTLSATTKGRRAPVAASQAARVSTWPAPKRTIGGRCISIGFCRVGMGVSSGEGEPAGLLDLRVGVEAGGEQAAGVGLGAGVSKISRTVPISTTRPFSMTITWSAKSRTTGRSWAMKMKAMPSSRLSLSSSAMTCAWIETSSAETASSAMISSGSSASARAMAMRWRWPPENWCG